MDIRYTVKYTKRKSIGIKINPDFTVTVTAPVGTPPETVERVVVKHGDWIVSHLAKMDSGLSGTEDKTRKKPVPGVFVREGREIPYTVFYSDRSTISVKINCDASVTVRAPYGTTDGRIDEFLNGRADWILSHLGHMEKERDRFAGVVNQEKILLSGREYSLRMAERTCLTEDTLYLKSLGALKGFVVREYGDRLAKKTRDTAERLGLKLKDVRFRSYKARWGCCDSNGVISFNYKLLMLPEDLQFYVAVHELCHLTEMNHSSRFWRAVESVLPDYRERHEKSHEYDFLLRLYP